MIVRLPGERPALTLPPEPSAPSMLELQPILEVMSPSSRSEALPLRPMFTLWTSTAPVAGLRMETVGGAFTGGLETLTVNDFCSPPSPEPSRTSRRNHVDARNQGGREARAGPDCPPRLEVQMIFALRLPS